MHRGSAEALQQGAAFPQLQQAAGPTSVSKGGAHPTHCSLSKADCPFLVCFLMMQREDRSIKEKEIIELGANGEEASQTVLFFLASPHTACLHLTKPTCCISDQVLCLFLLPLGQLPISSPSDLEPSPSLLLLSLSLTIALDGHQPSLFCPLSFSALLWFNSSYCTGTWPRNSYHH